jgi:uncharacterized membrane protein YphA (DoxX/SURF4 family)
MSEQRVLGASIQRDLHWVSVFLRLSIGSLFLSAGITKLPGGVTGTVAYYTSLFEHSLLPMFLVRAHASLIMFVELGLGLWLLSGVRLALAWKVAALVLTSLAVGMLFAAKYDVAHDNYVYVLLSAAGLLASRFDRWVWRSAGAVEHALPPLGRADVELGH